MTEKPNPDTEHYFAETPKSEPKLGMVQTRLRGEPFKFLTSSSVFSKKQIDAGTRLLIEAMQLPDTGSVLDLGCGYGAVGIVAAAVNPRLHVVMTDVNMRAVQLARRNIKINKVRNAKVHHGYLYEPLNDSMFTCILSNPPVSAGMETVLAIIQGAPTFLSCDGTLQMVVRSKIGKKTLPNTFTSAFGNCSVLARKSGYRVLVAKKT
jgi:16S rRNA (guanine1207-N2)-methyltransferase